MTLDSSGEQNGETLPSRRESTDVMIISNGEAQKRPSSEDSKISDLKRLRPFLNRPDHTRGVEAKSTKVTTILDPVSEMKAKRKIKRCSRKQLEAIAFKLFAESTLYASELGNMKVLTEKLESLLEANRKKTAQFHKEVRRMYQLSLNY